MIFHIILAIPCLLQTKTNLIKSLIDYCSHWLNSFLHIKSNQIKLNAISFYYSA